MAEHPEKDLFPGVDRAYDFVVPSYQLLVARFEAADGRLNNLVTFISSMVVGLPVFARAVRPEANFASPLFLVAIAVLVVAAMVGISVRLSGRLKLVDPTVLYREALQETEWEFKKNAIFYAGRHFTANADAIDRKGDGALITSLLMLVALVIAAAWLAS
jgi:hypothetical protein